MFWRLLGKRLRINIVFADLGPQRACVQSKQACGPVRPGNFPIGLCDGQLDMLDDDGVKCGEGIPFAEESYRSIMLLATEGDFSAMKDCFSALMSL